MRAHSLHGSLVVLLMLVALGMGEELGMRPLIAHCHLGLGKLYRQVGGKGQEAREHLTTAGTMLRDMDMRFWLARANAVLAAPGAVQHLSRGRETIEQAIDLWLALRPAFFQLGELARMGESLREAQLLAAAVGDQARLGRVAAFMAHFFWLRGDHDGSGTDGVEVG